MKQPRLDIAKAMRLDKWLWCARVFKSRSDAAAALRSGKVQIGGEKVKPAKLAAVDMVLEIRSGALIREIAILALTTHRLPASDAAALYRESAASITRREQHAAQVKLDRALHPRTPGRPSKRDRRRIIQFRRAGPNAPGDDD